MTSLKKNFLVIILNLLILLVFSYSQEGRGQGRIFGTVVDKYDKPLEGVEILLEARDFNFKTKTTTDKKGRWAIAGLGSGVFRITATKEGFVPTMKEINVSQFKNPPIKIVLEIMSEQPAETKGLDDASRKLFIDANSLYEQGNYAGALALFQEFVEKNPFLHVVRLNIGNCYREMGKYDKALSEYNTVLERLSSEKADLKGDQNAAKALTSIGEVYMILNNYDKAQEYLKKAIDIYPNDHALAYNVAEIFFQSGKVEEAIEYYNLALKIKPDWAQGYLKLGFALINKNNFPEAIKSFEKFLELDPQNPQANAIKSLIEELKKK